MDKRAVAADGCDAIGSDAAADQRDGLVAGMVAGVVSGAAWRPSPEKKC